MSQIGCLCGARVSDTLMPNPAKARFVRDVDFEAAYERLADLSAGYLDAVLTGTSADWLRAQGFADDYVALNLTHAEIFSDLGALVFNDAQFDILECGACGRLLVEAEPNRFSYYCPDEARALRPFGARHFNPPPSAPPPAA